MKNKFIIWAIVLLGASVEASLAQQPPPQSAESHKYRTILTLAGGGGGFALGTLGGIAAFEDATYGSRKVWTTALISAAGGAVGGYFLGRFLDKRKKNRDVVLAPPLTVDNWTRSLIEAQRSNMQLHQQRFSHASSDISIVKEACFRGSNPIILLSAKSAVP